jgi:Tfp pilus assembly protein PilF
LFARARDLAPSDPAVLTGFAQFLRQQGRLREAVEVCDAAIRAEPGYADAWIERGTILSGGGSDRAASDSFVRALALAPRAAMAHAGLAAIAAKNGAADLVREHARAGLQRSRGSRSRPDSQPLRSICFVRWSRACPNPATIARSRGA